MAQRPTTRTRTTLPENVDVTLIVDRTTVKEGESVLLIASVDRSERDARRIVAIWAAEPAIGTFEAHPESQYTLERPQPADAPRLEFVTIDEADPNKPLRIF